MGKQDAPEGNVSSKSFQLPYLRDIQIFIYSKRCQRDDFWESQKDSSLESLPGKPKFRCQHTVLYFSGRGVVSTYKRGRPTGPETSGNRMDLSGVRLAADCGRSRKMSKSDTFGKGILQGTNTYPTWRDFENHLQTCQLVGDMLVPRKVSPLKYSSFWISISQSWNTKNTSQDARCCK